MKNRLDLVSAKAALKSLIDGLEKRTGYQIERSSLRDLIGTQIVLRVNEEVKSRIEGFNLAELTMMRVVLETDDLGEVKPDKKIRKAAH